MLVVDRREPVSISSKICLSKGEEIKPNKFLPFGVWILCRKDDDSVTDSLKTEHGSDICISMIGDKHLKSLSNQSKPNSPEKSITIRAFSVIVTEE